MVKPRRRDLGYCPSSFKTGPQNSILDVKGVQVGQVTLHEGSDVHVGVTVIMPRGVSQTRSKPCYAAYHHLNGVGELTGPHWIDELRIISTPIAFTNTVSVGRVYDGVNRWTLEQAHQAGEDDLQVIRRLAIPVVGETLDAVLNDVAQSRITDKNVYEAVENAQEQDEELEGNHGGGTGMRCHGSRGVIGTSSRPIPRAEGGNYTLDVIAQGNYGAKQDLRIGWVPVGPLLEKSHLAMQQNLPDGGKAADGSILVLTITDAPLPPHQLKRFAQRSGIGITQVAGQGAGRRCSGEIFLAFSIGTTPEKLAERDGSVYLPELDTEPVTTFVNEIMDSLFYAASETTEESILNALCLGRDLDGFRGENCGGTSIGSNPKDTG